VSGRSGAARRWHVTPWRCCEALDRLRFLRHQRQ
jgi:hypothetical protein